MIEEIAIASGSPVPEIYLLADEPGINAFAAAFSTSDAAARVTRGCFGNLTRDELQGVIAHEFSHVLKGDMRLNMRLMGLLFGILVLAIVGRKSIWLGGGRGRRGGGEQVWMIGLAMVAVGYIGYFFGRLIQAAVARSRESLADASAMQFIRQTSGIAVALKKIAILAESSTLEVANKQAVAHMLFGEAGKYIALFATHPPLLERIRTLEPGFREQELQHLAVSLQHAEVIRSASLKDAHEDANVASNPRVPGIPPARPGMSGAAASAAGAAIAAAAVAPAFVCARVITTVIPTVSSLPCNSRLRPCRWCSRWQPRSSRSCRQDNGVCWPTALAMTCVPPGWPCSPMSSHCLRNCVYRSLRWPSLR